MPSKGCRNTLGDYFTLQRGTTYKSRLLGQPGPVLLGLATIQRNGGFRTDSLQTYGGDSPTKLIVRPGELYLSLKDVTQSADLLGAVARLPYDHLPGRLTQDTVKLEPRSADVPLDYLYWLLRTPQYRTYCRAHATGTTNLGLAREDFLSFPAPEPTPMQLHIVETLGALDNKIEMNRKMNETLEAMAQALFKSWFVDFDPVRAKAEGRDPVLPAPIAALFPDSFEDSELGEIPKGWKVGRLDDLLVLQRGFDLPTTTRTPGSYSVIAASGPNGTHDEFMVRGPGVTTGRSGVLGKVFFVHEDFWPLNTSLWVKEFKQATPAYAFHLLRGIDFRRFNAGSAVPTLNRNHVHGMATLLPPHELVRAFQNHASAILNRLRASEMESTTLGNLRDALLPKFISGELRVGKAAELVEAAI
jgi:type I restriction enzyme S subunit